MVDLVVSIVPALVLGGSVATIVAVLRGVHRGLKRAGWADDERRSTVGILATLLVGWFFVALVLAWLGFFRGTASQIPTIQYGIFLPLVAGFVLFWRWKLLRRVVEAVPQQWIAGVQFFRVEGAIFLVLYAAGRLPREFAWPAGVGDIAVGLLAPIVAIAYARRSNRAAGWLIAWNLLGISDLVVALTTGFLTSPSKLQMLAFDRPNQLMGILPLVMIPVFLVPLALLLHSASLQKLRQENRAGSSTMDDSKRAFSSGVRIGQA
jgi:hypothetical protein